MFLNFFIFKKIKVSGSNIKKVVIFSQKGAFLIFKETETLKKLFAFQKCELSYILGNGNLKKLLLFQEVTFQARKMRKTHFEKSFIFPEMKLSSQKHKKLLTFQEELPKPQKPKLKSYLAKGNLLNTTILLISISFNKIGLLY